MKKLIKLLQDYNNPRKYVQVSSVEEYFALPRNRRTKWGFWYLYPMSLPMGDFFDMGKVRTGQWEEWHNKIAKEFPVQYFCRKKFEDAYRYLFGNFGIIKELKYKISCFFFPEHQELRKAIPREWQDLDSIIENFLYTCIISYVEKENGLRELEEIKKFENKDPESKEFDQWGGYESFIHYKTGRLSDLIKILNIYDWAKIGRYKAERGMDVEMMSCGGDYEKYDKLEEEFIKKDTEYLTEIINLRRTLWS